MKITFTPLFILYSCFKLSASPIHPDTLKLSSTTNYSDIANISVPVNYTAYCIKLTATIIPQYSIKLSAQINNSAFQMDSLISSAAGVQIKRDSLKQQIKRNYQVNLARLLGLNDLDSLKQELKLAASDTIKALIYTRIAAIYLNYDTISSKKKQLIYQNKAITYTLLAIQKYAADNDSTALRKCFDNLAKVYYAQKKYSQAKWFILQSNTLSRARNDIPNIISSLLTLSLVKRDIKDYSLAMGDLNEALQLSITNHSPKAELDVLKNYASLYHQLKNYPKEAAVLKKLDSLDKSILKNEKAQFIAKLAIQDTRKKKKPGSVQNKKKVNSSNLPKIY